MVGQFIAAQTAFATKMQMPAADDDDDKAGWLLPLLPSLAEIASEGECWMQGLDKPEEPLRKKLQSTANMLLGIVGAQLVARLKEGASLEALSPLFEHMAALDKTLGEAETPSEGVASAKIADLMSKWDRSLVEPFQCGEASPEAAEVQKAARLSERLREGVYAPVCKGVGDEAAALLAKFPWVFLVGKVMVAKVDFETLRKEMSEERPRSGTVEQMNAGIGQLTLLGEKVVGWRKAVEELMAWKEKMPETLTALAIASEEAATAAGPLLANTCFKFLLKTAKDEFVSPLQEVTVSVTVEGGKGCLPKVAELLEASPDPVPEDTQTEALSLTHSQAGKRLFRRWQAFEKMQKTLQEVVATLTLTVPLPLSLIELVTQVTVTVASHLVVQAAFRPLGDDENRGALLSAALQLASRMEAQLPPKVQSLLPSPATSPA